MSITKSIAVLASVVLLLALGPWPYGYYQLLRVVVFAAGVFAAISFWQREQALAVGLLLCAVIFNPFLPIHLNREIWSVLNIAAAAVFGFAAYRAHRAANIIDVEPKVLPKSDD
jgi:uncharacterized membrane protein YccC